MDFVQLYVQTEYSMLESPAKLEKLIQKASKEGYRSLAITDADTISGILKFFMLCKQHQIKPIIGAKCTLASSIQSTILLYAKNEIGYQNLLKIVTEGKLNKSGIELSFIKQHQKGLIAILPSDESEIIQLSMHVHVEELIQQVKRYKESFEELYFGLDMQTEVMRIHIDEWISFANEVGLKPVALHRSVYVNEQDCDAYQVLKCIGQQTSDYRLNEKEWNMHFPHKKDIIQLFAEYPELVKETKNIANQCTLEIPLGSYHLPEYTDSPIDDHDRYLAELCKFGLNKRLKGKEHNIGAYKTRLLHEINIIHQMGFSDYFLIVYDFIKFAKKNQILVGPGRGSAPGSLVAYALGITDVDPLEHQLLFERFLNPERISMPDIDTDFPDNRRDEIIRYVGEKYGKDKIAHISTFGTFGVRLAIRDVARVLNMSDSMLNEVLKYIPSTGKIHEIIEKEKELARLAVENEQIQKLIQLVEKLEGLPRHTSTHAAGIVMTKEPLVQYTALQEGINNLYQTQFEATDLEKLGLVKMDFLGLRNLTIIDRVIEKIRENGNATFKITDIPMNDAATYALIAKGETDGIFQLESSGMRNVLVQLKTVNFDDIVHANALFRPGPMEMIPSFVKRKFKKEKISYPHDDLKDILEPTYGIIVFQEQIMLIAQRFGYTLGEADVLRRAVSKKNAETLEAERVRFVAKSKEKGYQQSTAHLVYDYIVKFANYGFNKSHSVAYSLISYQMAYLKEHFYRYFILELMNNSIGSINMLRTYLSDCKKKGLNVRMPSIQKSREIFIIEGNDIYYPLLGIQNAGSVTVANLLQERDQNGLYKDYIDFVGRTKSIINKRIAESMIYAGALDDFHISRKQMVLEYDQCLELYRYSHLLVDRLEEKQFTTEEYSFEEARDLEREALGFNLKYSVFRNYEKQKREKNINDITDLSIGATQIAMFYIKQIRLIKTKNGDEMAFLDVFDDSDRLDCVLFPKDYIRSQHLLVPGKVYFAKGKVEERNGKKQMVIEQIALAKIDR